MSSDDYLERFQRKRQHDYLGRLQRERQRLPARYGDFFEKIAAILFRHDPVRINLETNTDEYFPEARTILPRLEIAKSEDDAERIVLEEFQAWFGPNITVQEDRCVSAARDIWQAWSQRTAARDD